jgi:hypothetical protein
MRRKAKTQTKAGAKAMQEELGGDGDGEAPSIYSGFSRGGPSVNHEELSDDEFFQVSTTRRAPKTVDAKKDAGLGEAEAFKTKDFIAHSSRSAGALVFVRPCGVCVAWWPMYHAESLSQIYLFIHAIFTIVVQLGFLATSFKLSWFIYDYSCGMRNFVHKREKVNVFGQALGLFGRHGVPMPQFLVDRFHMVTHVDEYCKKHCNLADFPELDHMNSETAEQMFSWFGKYKYSLGNMHVHA